MEIKNIHKVAGAIFLFILAALGAFFFMTPPESPGGFWMPGSPCIYSGFGDWVLSSDCWMVGTYTVYGDVILSSGNFNGSDFNIKINLSYNGEHTFRLTDGATFIFENGTIENNGGFFSYFIVLDDGTIFHPSNGSIIINVENIDFSSGGGGETPTEFFIMNQGAAKDLRPNSTAIADSSAGFTLDGNGAAYTDDWSTFNISTTFKIQMNASQNKIQIYAIPINDSYLYLINLDNNDSTGFNGTGDGVSYDLVISNSPNVLGFNLSVGYYNVTKPNPFSGVGWFDIIPYDGFTTNDSDPDMDLNFTVYFKNNSNAIEIIVDMPSEWKDKLVLAADPSGGNPYWTKFKNSSVTGGATNNTQFILDNATLYINYDFDIGDSPNADFRMINGAEYNASYAPGNQYIDLYGNWYCNDSLIDMGNEFIIENYGGGYYIENCTITATGAGQWEANLGKDNSFITNSYLDDARYVRVSGNYFLFENNTLNKDGGWGLYLQDQNQDSIVRGNNFTDTSDITIYLSLSGSGNNIIVEDNWIAGWLMMTQGSDINVTNNTFYGMGFMKLGDSGGLTDAPANLILKNNDWSQTGSATAIQDEDLDMPTTMIYENTDGTIDWAAILDLNIFPPFGIGQFIYLENNVIGVDIDYLPALNESSNITFRGLDWDSTPIVLKAGVRCDDQPDCSIQSYNTNPYIPSLSFYIDDWNQPPTEMPEFELTNDSLGTFGGDSEKLVITVDIPTPLTAPFFTALYSSNKIDYDYDHTITTYINITRMEISSQTYPHQFLVFSPDALTGAYPIYSCALVWNPDVGIDGELWMVVYEAGFAYNATIITTSKTSEGIFKQEYVGSTGNISCTYGAINLYPEFLVNKTAAEAANLSVGIVNEINSFAPISGNLTLLMYYYNYTTTEPGVTNYNGTLVVEVTGFSNYTTNSSNITYSNSLIYDIWNGTNWNPGDQSEFRFKCSVIPPATYCEPIYQDTATNQAIIRIPNNQVDNFDSLQLKSNVPLDSSYEVDCGTSIIPTEGNLVSDSWSSSLANSGINVGSYKDIYCWLTINPPLISPGQWQLDFRGVILG